MDKWKAEVKCSHILEENHVHNNHSRTIFLGMGETRRKPLKETENAIIIRQRTVQWEQRAFVDPLRVEETSIIPNVADQGRNFKLLLDFSLVWERLATQRLPSRHAHASNVLGNLRLMAPVVRINVNRLNAQVQESFDGEKGRTTLHTIATYDSTPSQLCGSEEQRIV